MILVIVKIDVTSKAINDPLSPIPAAPLRFVVGPTGFVVVGPAVDVIVRGDVDNVIGDVDDDREVGGPLVVDTVTVVVVAVVVTVVSGVVVLVIVTLIVLVAVPVVTVEDAVVSLEVLVVIVAVVSLAVLVVIVAVVWLAVVVVIAVVDEVFVDGVGHGVEWVVDAVDDDVGPVVVVVGAGVDSVVDVVGIVVVSVVVVGTGVDSVVDVVGIVVVSVVDDVETVVVVTSWQDTLTLPVVELLHESGNFALHALIQFNSSHAGTSAKPSYIGSQDAPSQQEHEQIPTAFVGATFTAAIRPISRTKYLLNILDSFI
jgi:hypothetical protein